MYNAYSFLGLEVDEHRKARKLSQKLPLDEIRLGALPGVIWKRLEWHFFMSVASITSWKLNQFWSNNKKSAIEYQKLNEKMDC